MDVNGICRWISAPKRWEFMGYIVVVSVQSVSWWYVVTFIVVHRVFVVERGKSWWSDRFWQYHPWRIRMYAMIMVTFAMYIPQMLAYILPYMDPMGHGILLHVDVHYLILVTVRGFRRIHGIEKNMERSKEIGGILWDMIRCYQGNTHTSFIFFA